MTYHFDADKTRTCSIKRELSEHMLILCLVVFFGLLKLLRHVDSSVTLPFTKYKSCFKKNLHIIHVLTLFCALLSCLILIELFTEIVT